MATNSGDKTLGIYFSSSEICISEVALGKDSRPEVLHLVKIPTGFTAKTGMIRPLSINNDFFNESASWIKSFTQAVKKISWGSSKTVVTFSPQFSILRYFVMPMIERKFWSRSIPLESKKYIPVSFEEVIHDFNAAALEGGKKLGILFGLTQRKSVEFLINTLNSSGLELASLEVSPCSLERLFSLLDPKEHNSKAYMHFYASQSLTLFSSDGCPVLYRENDFDSASSLTERKRLDVKGAMQFVDRYVGGQSYTSLMLSGENLEVWKGVTEQESPMPPVVWEPAKLAGLKDNDAAAFFSLGASIKGVFPGKVVLDLSGLSTADRIRKLVQGYVWNISAFFGGTMLLFSLVLQVKILMLDSKISAYKAQMEDVSELIGSSPQVLKAKIAAIKENKLSIANILAGNESEFLAPKLQVLYNEIPLDLWLTDVKYANSLTASGAQNVNKSMVISGQTSLRGDMKSHMVGILLKALKTAPEYRAFTPPEGGIEFNLASEAGGAREESGFDIRCTIKRK